VTEDFSIDTPPTAYGARADGARAHGARAYAGLCQAVARMVTASEAR
jgi:hypothetical protein